MMLAGMSQNSQSLSLVGCPSDIISNDAAKVFHRALAFTFATLPNKPLPCTNLNDQQRFPESRYRDPTS